MSLFTTPLVPIPIRPRRDWESTFRSWGTAPSETKQTKCANAERAIRKAIDADRKLSSKDISVFAQGSYANRTNVRQDSDVDICVLCKESFFPDYSFSPELNDGSFGYTDATYTYAEFKNDVERALISYFGSTSVSRGYKAFDVHANSYRIDADVVPAFEYRRFYGSRYSNGFHSGTLLRPDNGGRIINWPRQNYDNGVARNDITGRRFKAVVRILKRLRNEMAQAGYHTAAPIPSYLIECLVWNVPPEAFGHDDYKADLRWVLAHLWNETRADATCQEWGEINELKYLILPSQPWSREQINQFLQSAWDYVGYK